MLVRGERLEHPEVAAKSVETFIKDATSGEVQWVHQDVINALTTVSEHLANYERRDEASTTHAPKDAEPAS